MSSARRQRWRLARWERGTRRWATDAAKALAIDLYQDNEPGIAPYTVGVVLDGGEKPWVQIIARCSFDRTPTPRTDPGPPLPPLTDWLVTNKRIVGRTGDGVLLGWRWEWIVGLLTDLTAGNEYVHLDSRKEGYPPRVDWTGPGVLPLAVAAVYHVYGVKALLEHPGLASIRAGTGPRDTEIQPPIAQLATPPRPSNRGL